VVVTGAVGDPLGAPDAADETDEPAPAPAPELTDPHPVTDSAPISAVMPTAIPDARIKILISPSNGSLCRRRGRGPDDPKCPYGVGDVVAPSPVGDLCHPFSGQAAPGARSVWRPDGPLLVLTQSDYEVTLCNRNSDSRARKCLNRS
jgi:hypothetical protein